MKKLLSLALAAVLLLSCLAVPLVADENQLEISVSVSDGTVTLRWDEIDDEVGYQLYWKRSSSDVWNAEGTILHHKVNIHGLTNGISYDFKIGFGDDFSEVVTATPIEDPVAVIEYYSGGEYVEYSIKDSEAVDTLRLAYESLWYNSTYTSRGIGYPYYKITVPNGEDEAVFYVTGDGLVSSPETKNAVPTDGTDYFAMIEDIVDKYGVRIGTLDMPFTASDVTNAYTYEVGSEDEIWQGILENEQTINTLLSMYFALEDIVEPTDETMDFWKEGFIFDYEGETYSFYVDKNNVVCFDYFGERYKITTDADYYSQLHDILYDFSDSVYYEGTKSIFDDDAEIAGTATIEIGSETYEITDPDDLDNLKIIYESFGYNLYATSKDFGENSCTVTMTVDGKEVSFSVSENNVINRGGKLNFATVYGSDYYSTIVEMAENSTKQYRAVTVTHVTSSNGLIKTTITDESDIENLVSIYESLPDITEPSGERFRLRNYYRVNYRDSGEEVEFWINSDNLVKSESLGDGVYAITDGVDYYEEVVGASISEP